MNYPERIISTGGNGKRGVVELDRAHGSSGHCKAGGSRSTEKKHRRLVTGRRGGRGVVGPPTRKKSEDLADT